MIAYELSIVFLLLSLGSAVIALSYAVGAWIESGKTSRKLGFPSKERLGKLMGWRKSSEEKIADELDRIAGDIEAIQPARPRQLHEIEEFAMLTRRN